MDRTQLTTLYDHDQRINVEYPDSRREITPEVVRHIDTSDFRQGTVIYSQLTESNADEVIREQGACFERLGQNFEWKLFEHDRPPVALKLIHTRTWRRARNILACYQVSRGGGRKV